MARHKVSANRPWERIVGYSRAVRAGSTVEVSGTAPADADGNILHPGDAYLQAKAALAIIGDALREAGAAFEDVVRTRVLLKRIEDWEEAGRAHGEVFSEIRPANTTMAVAGFIDEEILVEIEVSAIVGDRT
ncbi:MAG: RidA family protein [Actinomycetota bacterium]|nr:RidA family protein [Actinomycetota bacterium]